MFQSPRSDSFLFLLIAVSIALRVRLGWKNYVQGVPISWKTSIALLLPDLFRSVSFDWCLLHETHAAGVSALFISPCGLLLCFSVWSAQSNKPLHLMPVQTVESETYTHTYIHTSSPSSLSLFRSNWTSFKKLSHSLTSNREVDRKREHYSELYWHHALEI